MYIDYFELRTLPFRNTPDPAFFFMEAQYRETLEWMVQGVLSRKGLLCITGQIGCGKTMLSTVLKDHLPDETIITFVVHPKLTPKELTELVARSLGLQDLPDSQLECIERIRDKLVQINEAGTHCVFIVDEAQLLSDSLLQEILMFTNLETSHYKLLQIILLGQKELLDKLNRPEMRQLTQRIFSTKFIKPIGPDQSIRYIKHRMKIAGGFSEIFTEDAIDLIVKSSDGIPRIINTLCDMSLYRVYSSKKDSVEITDVQASIIDLGLDVFAKTQMHDAADHIKILTTPKSVPSYAPEVDVTEFSEGPDEKSNILPYPSTDKAAAGDTAKLLGREAKKESHPGRKIEPRWFKVAGIGIVLILLITVVIWQLKKGSVSEKTENSVPDITRQKVEQKKLFTPPSAPRTSASDRTPENIIATTNLDKSKPIEHVGGANNNSLPTLDENIPIPLKDETPTPSKEILKEEAELNPSSPSHGVAASGNATATESDPQKQTVAYPYSIYLGAYRTRARAENALKILQEMNLSPYRVRVVLRKKGVWYRIFLGYFKDYHEAEKTIAIYNLKNAEIKNTKYATCMGTFASVKETHSKIQFLHQRGYSPYVIPGASGKSRVYVGAFYTRRGAETLSAELKSKGIISPVVLR
jgi:general secretion pathway protein A